MHAKGLKKLQSTWKEVRKKGGHFLLALNGFPTDKSATPTLVVSAKKKLERTELGRVADEPKLDKLISGRISVDDGRFTFVIDEDSLVKSPAVLKQAVRQLAKKDELGDLLNKATQGTFRNDEEIELDDEATLDTSATAKERGGKSSKLTQLVGSAWTKLLTGLDRWQAKFAGRLDAANVVKADVQLVRIEAQLEAWRARHANDDGKAGRRAEVERVQTAVTAARQRIAQYTAAVRDDDAADAVIDALAAGTLTKDPQELATLLRSAEDNLGKRYGSATDPDERAVLKTQLDNLRAAITKNLGDRTHALAKRSSQPTNDLEETNRRITEGVALTVEVRAQAEDVFDVLSNELVDTKTGTPEAEQLFRAIDGLDDAGGKKSARQLRNDIVDRATELLADEYRNHLMSLRTEGEKRQWIGSLGRGNANKVALRARAIESIGRPYMKEVTDRLKVAVGTHGKRPFGKYDHEAQPEAFQKQTEIESIIGKRTKAMVDARDVLKVRVQERIAEFGGTRQDAQLLVDSKLRAPNPNDPPGPLPTVDSVVLAYFEDHPEHLDTFVERSVRAAMKFISTQNVMDTEGYKTEELLVSLTRARIEDGLPVDVSSLVRALGTPDNWSVPIDLDDLDVRLVQAGVVSTEDLAANQSAGEHVLDARRIADGELADAYADLIALDQDVHDAVIAGFKAVVDPMLTNPSAIPKPTRMSVFNMYAAMAELGPTGELAGLTLASDALFLRWISKFNVNSPGLGIATQLSALFMNCANRTIPNKNDSLPFVGLVREYTPKFAKFLLDVLDVARQDTPDATVEIDDQVTRTVLDPITKKPVTGKVHSDHPERPKGSTPDDLEKKVQRRQNDALMEAMQNPTPDNIWPTYMRQQAQTAIQQFARMNDDDVVLVKGNRNVFIAKLKPFFLRKCQELDSALVYSNGKMPAVHATVEELKRLMQLDVDEVLEGGRGELFVTVDGDDDLLDATEHWDALMFPRFIGALNSLLTGELMNVRAVKPFTLGDTVLATTKQKYLTVFDKQKHQRLPTERKHMDKPILEVYEHGIEALTRAIEAVAQRKASTDDFAWDPIQK